MPTTPSTTTCPDGGPPVGPTLLSQALRRTQRRLRHRRWARASAWGLIAVTPAALFHPAWLLLGVTFGLAAWLTVRRPTPAEAARHLDQVLQTRDLLATAVHGDVFAGAWLTQQAEAALRAGPLPLPPWPTRLLTGAVIGVTVVGATWAFRQATPPHTEGVATNLAAQTPASPSLDESLPPEVTPRRAGTSAAETAVAEGSRSGDISAGSSPGEGEEAASTDTLDVSRVPSAAGDAERGIEAAAGDGDAATATVAGDATGAVRAEDVPNGDVPAGAPTPTVRVEALPPSLRELIDAYYR